MRSVVLVYWRYEGIQTMKRYNKMIEKEIAGMIDGLEYGGNIDPVIIAYAKRHGVVIVFGASDDQMEFRGAIKDEASCSGGGWIYFNRSGELRSLCDSEDCPYFDVIRKKASKIKAIWDSEGYAWTYETEFPHETFEIVDDGEKYCRGIVFSVDVITSE